MRSPWLGSLTLLSLLLLNGCGGGDTYQLGKVEGVVTLDGEPLTDADIRFQPPKGRSSVGKTDSNGHYTLQYTPDREGAEIATHIVVITTAHDPSGGEGDQPFVPGQKELLPAKYHSKTELTSEVKSGTNTANFDLTSN